MVEEVVLAHGAHVGADTLPDLALELPQGHPLPLGRRLHDLGVDALLEAEPAGELDRRARAVAVEVVVDPALAVDDQRHLDHLEVELLAEVVLDGALDLEEGLLRVQAVEQGGVVRWKDLLHLRVRADAGSGQVRPLVRHRSRSPFV